MDISNLNSLLEKCEGYFLMGKFTEARACVSKIIEDFKDFTSSNLGMDAATFSTILENNKLVAECLQIRWNAENFEKISDQLLVQFKSLHRNCKHTGLKIRSQELHLWLNLVHNYLFWSWINPKVDKNKNSDYIEEKLQLVINCLFWVMETFHESSLGCMLEGSPEVTVLELMKATYKKYITFNPLGPHNIGIQLLEIYFLTLLIIIESIDDATKKSSDVHLLKSCADFIQDMVTSKSVFYYKDEVHCRPSTSTGITVSLFKFGFRSIYSKVGDSDLDTIFDALCFAGSLCFIAIEQFKPSLAFLSPSNISCENDGEPSFILNYLKACIYFQLDDVEKSLLFLRKLFSRRLGSNIEARCSLLYGLILSYNGQFVDAENEFAKVQKIDSYLPMALYYSALNYKSYAQSHLNEGEVSMWRGCQSKDQRKRLCEAVSIREPYTTTLNALVKLLQHRGGTGTPIKTYYWPSLEMKLLSIIHPQPEITASRAIYLLAKELAVQRKFSLSADKLLYLLKEEQNEHHLDQLGLAVSPLVPPNNILMNETTAVLIQAERWKDAEIVCKKSLSNCASTTEAMIPDLFLAQIQMHYDKNDDAFKTLVKCMNSVNKWVTEYASDYMELSTPEASNEELNKAIDGKVALHFGFLFLGKQSPDVAKNHFRRALRYTTPKLDKDALYQLLLYLKNRGTTGREMWEQHQAAFNIPHVSFTNMALDYLLETRVTKEQLEQLSVDFLLNIPNFLEELKDEKTDVIQVNAK